LQDEDNQEKDEKDEFYIEDDNSTISIQALTIYLSTTSTQASTDASLPTITLTDVSLPTMSIQSSINAFLLATSTQALTDFSLSIISMSTQAFIDVSIQNDDLKFVKGNEPESVGWIKHWILSSGTDVDQLQDEDNQEKDEKDEFYIEDDNSIISIQALTIYLSTMSTQASTNASLPTMITKMKIPKKKKDESYIEYYRDSTMSIQALTDVSLPTMSIQSSINAFFLATSTQASTDFFLPTMSMSTQAFIDVSIQNDDLKFVEKNEPKSVGWIKHWILSSGTDIDQILADYRCKIPESQKCIKLLKETSQLFTTEDWTEMLKSLEDKIEIVKDDIPDIIYLFFDKNNENSKNIVIAIDGISLQKAQNHF
ncbi:27550_t:CDS:2, partial [Dentiscutata erythropus]